MDNAEKSDICSKTLRIFILELDVVQRSEGGNCCILASSAQPIKTPLEY